MVLAVDAASWTVVLASFCETHLALEEDLLAFVLKRGRSRHRRELLGRESREKTRLKGIVRRLDLFVHAGSANKYI